MTQEIVQIDAFTSEPFRGNPAAVCLMEEPASKDWMKLVAREMNLSETAFLYPIEDGFHLRWFTPKTEVDLCGHATLATAHFLFEEDRVPSDKPVRFKTRGGWLSAVKNGDWIELDFPANPPVERSLPGELFEALKVTPVFAGMYPKGYFVVVEHDDIVRKLVPDLAVIEKLPEPKVCVTAPDTTGRADFVSRLFAPALGINEDPVNGNSHTALTPYWAGRLGKEELTAYQASERGGILKVKNRGDRVTIAGQAVTVLRGRLLG
jgi:PhzF family phenazine biosynthesis protein